MTISKLFEKLKEFPQDATVKVWNEAESDFMPVTDIIHHQDTYNDEVRLVAMW